MRCSARVITRLVALGSVTIPWLRAAEPADLERWLHANRPPVPRALLHRMPRRKYASRPVRSPALLRIGGGCPGLSSLDPGDGETERPGDAPEAGAAAARGCAPNGDR